MRRPGGALLPGAALVGALALVASLVGFGVAPRRALFGWLFAWAYWGGIGVASLVLLGTQHASRARWVVVIRRALEVMAATIPLLAALFVPIAIGLPFLYPFASPAGLEEHAAIAVAHQRPYMNPTWFVARAVVYFAIWIAVSEALLRWSRRQDADADPGATRRMRILAAASLPAVALAMSFAALDWLMALEPLLHSSIYPLYWFTGAFLAAIALLALWTSTARGPGEPGALANASHRGSLGKLLLGFTLFWLYVAFCQWLLVWIADLPDEARWYVVRTTGGWGWVAWAIVLAQFALPFLVLLRRDVKERPAGLAAIAAWILAAHAVDTFWLVIPAADPAAPRLHWTDVTSFLAVGGLSVAFALARFRRGAPAATGDPYAEESLRYAGR